jgi:hypothetical protein
LVLRPIFSLRSSVTAQALTTYHQRSFDGSAINNSVLEFGRYKRYLPKRRIYGIQRLALEISMIQFGVSPGG